MQMKWVLDLVDLGEIGRVDHLIFSGASVQVEIILLESTSVGRLGHHGSVRRCFFRLSDLHQNLSQLGVS